MHSFLAKISTMHPEFRQTGGCAQADHMLTVTQTLPDVCRAGKSTSSCKIFHGKHLLKSTSTTQAVVSLSSAEAEGIGCVSMMRDLGDSLSLEIKLDATAGRAIAMRRGAGRIRHRKTNAVVAQRLVIHGDIKMTRVGGSDNCADLGTKHFGHQTMIRHLKFCGMLFAEGRSRKSDSDEH